jgi:hypothetical protein
MTGLEYHSNVYLADDTEQATVGGLAWVLNPSLSLELKGPKVQLEFGAGWGIRKFFDFQPNDGINIQNADRFTDFTSTLGINALSKNLVGVRLDNRFEVENLPSELPTSKTSSNIVHVSNDTNGGLSVRPGSALEIGLLGNVGLDRYTVPPDLTENNNPNLNNRVNYGPLVNAKWRFLPKTSLLGMVSLNWTRWDDNLVYAVGPETDGIDYGEYLGKPNATAWRTQWGLRGQFTDKLAAGVELGYGQMYYDEDSVIAAGSSLPDSSVELDVTGDETFARDLTSFSEGLLVNAQVAYAPAKGQTFVAGYQKDFQDAFFTNYVAYNYLFLRYQGLFASRVGVTGEVTYRIDGYHGEVARDDQNVAIKLGGAYRFNDYLSTGLSVGWNERACLDKECENGAFYATQYDDFWGQAGITFTY